jgi:hypothetical protein
LLELSNIYGNETSPKFNLTKAWITADAIAFVDEYGDTASGLLKMNFFLRWLSVQDSSTLIELFYNETLRFDDNDTVYTYLPTIVEYVIDSLSDFYHESLLFLGIVGDDNHSFDEGEFPELFDEYYSIGPFPFSIIDKQIFNVFCKSLLAITVIISLSAVVVISISMFNF